MSHQFGYTGSGSPTAPDVPPRRHQQLLQNADVLRARAGGGPSLRSASSFEDAGRVGITGEVPGGAITFGSGFWLGHARSEPHERACDFTADVRRGDGDSKLPHSHDPTGARPAPDPVSARWQPPTAERPEGAEPRICRLHITRRS